jgi:hypothetical protein
MATVNLLGLYQQAFSFAFIASNTRPKVLSPQSLNELTTPRSFTVQKSSFMDTPIFMPVKLDGYLLPNEPLIEISGSKTIIKTAIDGQNGTFKELYSLNDYSVVIRGLAINDEAPDEYPEEIVRKLKSLCEAPRSLEVVNLLCSFFDINRLSVESFSFPPLEGQIGVQPFEITCSSDREFDIELKSLK